MKRIIIIKRIVLTVLLFQLFILFAKNIHILYKYLYLHDTVNARVLNIETTSNNTLNLKSEIGYTLYGNDKKEKISHTIGEFVGDTIEIIVFSDGKVKRNGFCIGYSDIFCIVIYGYIYFIIKRKYEKERQKTLIEYSKKMYKRQVKNLNQEGDTNL